MFQEFCNRGEEQKKRDLFWFFTPWDRDSEGLDLHQVNLFISYYIRLHSTMGLGRTHIACEVIPSLVPTSVHFEVGSNLQHSVEKAQQCIPQKNSSITYAMSNYYYIQNMTSYQSHSLECHQTKFFYSNFYHLTILY